MFTAALFKQGKIWKQPKYPVTEEWTEKICYIYPVDYCSSHKKEILLLQQHRRN